MLFYSLCFQSREQRRHESDTGLSEQVRCTEFGFTRLSLDPMIPAVVIVNTPLHGVSRRFTQVHSELQ